MSLCKTCAGEKKRPKKTNYDKFDLTHEVIQRIRNTYLRGDEWYVNQTIETFVNPRHNIIVSDDGKYFFVTNDRQFRYDDRFSYINIHHCDQKKILFGNVVEQYNTLLNFYNDKIKYANVKFGYDNEEKTSDLFLQNLKRLGLEDEQPLMTLNRTFSTLDLKFVQASEKNTYDIFVNNPRGYKPSFDKITFNVETKEVSDLENLFETLFANMGIREMKGNIKFFTFEKPNKLMYNDKCIHEYDIEKLLDTDWYGDSESRPKTLPRTIDDMPCMKNDFIQYLVKIKRAIHDYVNRRVIFIMEYLIIVFYIENEKFYILSSKCSYDRIEYNRDYLLFKPYFEDNFKLFNIHDGKYKIINFDPAPISDVNITKYNTIIYSYKMEKVHKFAMYDIITGETYKPFEQFDKKNFPIPTQISENEIVVVNYDSHMKDRTHILYLKNDQIVLNRMKIN